MKPSSELGSFVRRSAISKSFQYFAYITLTLFTALSIFIYRNVIVPFGGGNISFSEEISILYYSITFIMSFALIILSIATFWARGPGTNLYDSAIVIDYKNYKKTIFIKDIQDIYLYSSDRRIFEINNIALRTGACNQWDVASARYTCIHGVIDFIRTRHASVYVPLVMQKLEMGLSIDFTYTDITNATIKQFAALNNNSYLNIRTKTMSLYKDRLVLGSGTVHFQDVQQFSGRDCTNLIQLTDMNGKILFSETFTSVFSADSFIDLLDKLINQKR